ncbi:hypothetical protein [Arthrobacter sp. NicSoilC5]|uniref:hypothetical protein n=1 Tax=Arthrobacter sp. NicSoilC5 TaxID=2831000 RepID=UPI001CC3A61A|nr:hypothetical protein [Arthrobacter sp. NicSoilC5]BCW78895.1 hypothetical protein NicSoilC5_09140 [Arthrobacter sp. NicSoilC5]
MALNTLVLAALFAAVFFYVLYGVILAAVRDGILQADERRQSAAVEHARDESFGSTGHGR